MVWVELLQVLLWFYKSLTKFFFKKRVRCLELESPLMLVSQKILLRPDARYTSAFFVKKHTFFSFPFIQRPSAVPQIHCCWWPLFFLLLESRAEKFRWKREKGRARRERVWGREGREGASAALLHDLQSFPEKWGLGTWIWVLVHGNMQALLDVQLPGPTNIL